MTAANTLARFLKGEARRLGEASPQERQALFTHAAQLEGRSHFTRNRT